VNPWIIRGSDLEMLSPRGQVDLEAKLLPWPQSLSQNHSHGLTHGIMHLAMAWHRSQCVGLVNTVKLLAYDIVATFTIVLPLTSSWPRPWTTGLGLDLRLVVLAMALFSASGVWIRLTSSSMSVKLWLTATHMKHWIIADSQTARQTDRQTDSC